MSKFLMTALLVFLALPVFADLETEANNNQATVSVECEKGGRTFWINVSDIRVEWARKEAQRRCTSYGGELTGREYVFGHGL
jgi:hypothetical protein